MVRQVVPKSLVEDQNYKLIVRWGNAGGPASVKLYYSYPGQTETIIPSSQYVYQELVGSSPYTVAVS